MAACKECHAPEGKPHGTNCSQRAGGKTKEPAPTAAQQPQGQQGRPMTAIERAAAKKVEAANALANLIVQKKDSLALVGGKHFNADRLVKLAHGVLTRTPALGECNPGTVLVCLMRCAELGLEPDAALPQKRMWLVPRNNRKLKEGKECTYVIDYRAKLQLARETGLVKSIAAEVVHEKDQFSYEIGSDGESVKKLIHKPDPFAEDRGKVRGYYALARLEGGEVQVVVWGLKKMEKFRDQHAPRKSDGSFAKSPWTEGHFDEMALKTMLNQLWNLLPAGTSEEAQRLQAIVREERDVEEGKKTAAVDLGIVPIEELAGGTEEAVEEALTGGGLDEQRLPDEKPAKPPDDVPFETADEEQARKEREKKGGEKREPGQEG